MPKKCVVWLAVFFLAVSLGSAAEYQENKELELSADGIEQFFADTGAGFLKVRGVEGLDRIEVDAEFIIRRMSDKKAQDFIKDNLILTLERKGSRAVLTAKQKPIRNLFKNISCAINLTVRIPGNLNVRIDDGSGAMTAEDIGGDVWIDDGSGDIELTNIGGTVEIDDGSGDLEARRITGDITVDDGSGTVDIEDCGGRVDIDDGSGTIRIRNVGGDVTISDGSGSINISGVEKDVHIRNDGSGSVNISDVRGSVTKKK